MSEIPKKSKTDDLLIEIGTEELPPTSLEKLSNNFASLMKKKLEGALLNFNDIQAFATPRRIAIVVSDLILEEPAKTTVKRGPAKTVGLDAHGNPTPQLLGFAKSVGVNVQDLILQETDKGAWFIIEQFETGKRTKDLIPAILKEVLKELPLPKRMRWGKNKDSFVRPIHWALVLLGNEYIKTNIFNITSDDYSYGHRFLHPHKISIFHPKDYEKLLLNEGKVRANFLKRKQYIIEAISQLASQATKGGAEFDIAENEALLNEVTGLVEWPVVLLGEFDERFLALPEEVLISTLKVHQRNFPLFTKSASNGKQKLLPKFIIVSNIESSDKECVIHGNEAVVSARLSDAMFIYEQDKKISLEELYSKLNGIVFQQGLGTLRDKAERIGKLAEFIIEFTLETSTDKNQQHLKNNISTVAKFCKADLLTQMVGEFPELQGIMGFHYTLMENHPKEIAYAIKEHYLPRFSHDRLPESVLGAIFALADRIDSLVGLFGQGKIPSGEKDPFGLRRQALAILRILIELSAKQQLQKQYHIFQHCDLESLIIKSKELYLEQNLLNEEVQILEPLLNFCFERLKGYYEEEEKPGIHSHARIFDAVVARMPTKPFDFYLRLKAVEEFQSLKEAESLSVANKRVKNILLKSEIPISPDTKFEEALLREPAEKKLADGIKTKELELKPLLAAMRYTEALKSLAELKEPIDNFFDNVMVMVEDKELRDNRIKLLNHLRELFLKIADISLL